MRALRSEPFSEAELTRDGFLGGRLVVAQPRDGYRAAMDPVLLAAAVTARAGDSVLELGCGAGVASLCLASRVPGLALHGVELQPGYGALARANAAANGIDLAVSVADIAALPEELRGRSFDHVLANPPYYPKDGGTAARDAGRERALREALPLSEWVSVALRRLRPGGGLTMIQAAERLPELVAALEGRAGSLVVLPISPRDGRPAGRVIVFCRKGGRGAFRLLAPFILHAGPAHLGDGDDQTEAARAVLREAGALVLQSR